MTQEQIKAELIEKRQTLMNLLATNKLAVDAVLNTQQLLIWKKLESILGIAESPQDIGPKTFIDYVADWVKDFILILEEERRTDIEIEVADIITSLREKIKKPDFPISVVLWKNLKAEINKLSSPTTAEGLRGALLNGFNAFNAEMNSKFPLTEHYKKNKSTYRSIKKKDLDAQTMIANDFETWLTGVLGVASAKQEKKKEKEEERKEKEEELENDFKEAYGKWLKNQRGQIKDIISEDQGTESTNNMSSAKFAAILLDQSKEWEAIQPELGQEIKGKIAAGSQGDDLAIKDYVNAMSAAYTNIATSETIIEKHWYEKRRFFDIAGLLTALVTENSGISKYDIIEEYIQWFGVVGGTVDGMNLSLNRQFVADKLIAGFEGALQDPELSFLVPKLIENIKAYDKKYLSLQETSKLWKSSIIHFIKNPDAILATQAGKDITPQSIDKFNEYLVGQAGVDALQKVFKQALRPLPKPDVFAKGEAIELSLELNDDTILVSKLLTTIDKENKVPYAIPSNLELNVTTGRSPYSFSANPIFSQSPVVENEEVKVAFEYTIVFSKDKGSSEVGGGKSTDQSITQSIDKTEEESHSKGSETTNSRGYNQSSGTAWTHGAQWEGEGSFFGLFSASGGTYHDRTTESVEEWTEETSETTSEEHTKTTAVTKGLSTTNGSSNSSSWNVTVQHGKDEGYLKVRGILTSANIEGDKMQISIHDVTVSSPDMKGLGIRHINAESEKEVRWKK